MSGISEWLGHRLATYLSKDVRTPDPVWAVDAGTLLRELQPGDVLLLDGNTRLSAAIRYITHSTWTHAALYVGDEIARRGGDASRVFIEADLKDGVRSTTLAAFAGQHVRICRPVGLGDAERLAVLDYAIGRIGARYDLRNVIDIARYLSPIHPGSGKRFNRRLLEMGSGDPSRAICSTLIAQAFQEVHYPILPRVAQRPGEDGMMHHVYSLRPNTLFVPADFDLSPYFEVVKPIDEKHFDFHRLHWQDGVSVR